MCVGDQSKECPKSCSKSHYNSPFMDVVIIISKFNTIENGFKMIVGLVCYLITAHPKLHSLAK